MKQNVTLRSKDRELFGVVIRQNTKDTSISITDLQRAYEKGRWQYGWSDRRINDILQSHSVQERIYHLLNEREMIKTTFPAFMDMIKNEGITKLLKGVGVWKTTGKGENKAVYADPYIWVLLAMELNPLLYAKVVIYLTDTLIFDRIDAGNHFKPMNSAINSIIPNPDYQKYARAINERVFGFHQTGMRNLASAKQLSLIAEIERFVIQSIRFGLIKTESVLLPLIKNYQVVEVNEQKSPEY